MIRQATNKETSSNLKIITKLLYEVCYSKEAEIFTNKYNKSESLKYFQMMFLASNNYFSYQNCFLKEIKQKVVAVILLIKDDEANLLLHHSWELAKKIFVYDKFIVKESKTGEISIEILAVSKNYQAKGYGTELINFTRNFFQNSNYQCLSLNVSYDNLRAQQLYLRNGFVVDSTIMILNQPYFHMTKLLNS